jgi:hypothetical protein
MAIVCTLFHVTLWTYAAILVTCCRSAGRGNSPWFVADPAVVGAVIAGMNCGRICGHICGRICGRICERDGLRRDVADEGPTPVHNSTTGGNGLPDDLLPLIFDGAEVARRACHAEGFAVAN